MKRLPHFTWNVSTLLFLVVISVSLVFVAGCTSNAVTPTSNSYQDRLDWMNEFFSPDGAKLGSGLGECPVLFDTVVTQQVGSDKAKFQVVFGDEEIEFDLPKDALSSSITLTIRATKYQAPFGSFWLLDCGPEGTTFSRPLEVIPSSKTTDNNVAVLFYYNPTAGQWEVEQVAASTDSELLIHHFSKYGIAD